MSVTESDICFLDPEYIFCWRFSSLQKDMRQILHILKPEWMATGMMIKLEAMSPINLAHNFGNLHHIT